LQRIAVAEGAVGAVVVDTGHGLDAEVDFVSAIRDHGRLWILDVDAIVAVLACQVAAHHMPHAG
jgi:hypothetical protein